MLEALPFWGEAVLLRRFDDTDKAVACAPAPFESYRTSYRGYSTRLLAPS